MKLNKIFAMGSLVIIVMTVSAFNEVTDQKESPKPTNLKILPKNISEEDLTLVMRGFNAALGVKCGHCHAGKSNGEKGLDFASDANPNKNIARAMMKMTQKINKKYFKEEHEGIIQNINCETCHNGKDTPKTVTIN